MQVVFQVLKDFDLKIQQRQKITAIVVDKIDVATRTMITFGEDVSTLNSGCCDGVVVSIELFLTGLHSVAVDVCNVSLETTNDSTVVAFIVVVDRVGFMFSVGVLGVDSPD